MKNIKLAVLVLCLVSVYQAQALTFGPVNESGETTIDDIALIINNESISRTEYEKELRETREAVPKDTKLSPSEIDYLVSERVIMQHLIDQLAKRAELNVKPETIDEAVASIAQGNQISVDKLYANVATKTGMNERQYRELIAKQIVQGQLRERVVGGDVRISQEQIDSQVALVARERGATLHLQDLLVAVVPGGTAYTRGSEYQKIIVALSEALEKNDYDLAKTAASVPGAKFNDLGEVNIGQIPPKFAFAVANLRSGEVVDAPIVDADGMHFLKVVSKTAAQGEGFIIPEARVRHILVLIDPTNPAAAKSLIDSIYQRLKSGADFSALAKQYSQDPGSAAKGGSLGWQSSDAVVPEFAKVMASEPLNTISAPFKTAFGWHVLEVTERRNVDGTEDKIRERIQQSLYEAALEQAWQQKLAQFRQAAYIKYY